MQIVIETEDVNIEKLSGKMYANLIGLYECTPLPEEHGRLMILSEDKLKENQIDFSFSHQKWISEVGLSNATVEIIEADAESEDKR